jgi:hypothetical protein
MARAHEPSVTNKRKLGIVTFLFLSPLPATMSTITVLEPFDAQMMDYPTDLDVPMHGSSEPWLISTPMDDDSPHLRAQAAPIEVDMEPFDGGFEFEMGDDQEANKENYNYSGELLDVEVYDVSRVPTPRPVPDIELHPDSLDAAASETLPAFINPDPSLPPLALPDPPLLSENPPEHVESSVSSYTAAVEPSNHLPSISAIFPADSESSTAPEQYVPSGGPPREAQWEALPNSDQPVLSSEDNYAEDPHVGGTHAEDSRAEDPYVEGTRPEDVRAEDTYVEGTHTEDVHAEGVHEAQADDARAEESNEEAGPTENFAHEISHEEHIQASPPAETVEESPAVESDNHADPHEISEGVYIDPPPAVLLSLPASASEEPEFSLFNQPETSSRATSPTQARDSLLTLFLHHRPTLYYEPLAHLFEAVRQDNAFVARFPDASEGELVLDANDLQLVLSEARCNFSQR